MTDQRTPQEVQNDQWALRAMTILAVCVAIAAALLALLVEGV